MGDDLVNGLIGGLRQPGESVWGCANAAEQTLLGKTGTAVLHSISGASLVASVATTPVGTAIEPTRESFKVWSWNRVPGSSMAEIGATLGVEKGLVPPVVGIAVTKVAPVVSKASLVLTAGGLATEAAFALSCWIP